MNHRRRIAMASIFFALLFSGEIAGQDARPDFFRFSQMGKPLPELVREEGARWFNSGEGVTLQSLRGKPILIGYTMPG